jgi:hypothetical protein
MNRDATLRADNLFDDHRRAGGRFELNEVLPYSPSCEVSTDNHPGWVARKATDRKRLPS